MHAIDERTTDPATVPVPRRRVYGSVVLGLVLLGAGVMWLLDALEVVDLRAAVVLPVLLGIVGLALVIGSFDGPHGGLMGLGVFLTVAVILAAVFPPNTFEGGIGERNYRVTSQEQLRSGYSVGMGTLSLDLSDLSLTESTAVDVSVGAGEIVIDLPADLPVAVEASAGAGDITLLGEQRDGLSVESDYVSPDFTDAPVRLTLDLHVAAGSIEVSR